VSGGTRWYRVAALVVTEPVASNGRWRVIEYSKQRRFSVQYMDSLDEAIDSAEGSRRRLATIMMGRRAGGRMRAKEGR
jgi:hypothetical protein